MYSKGFLFPGYGSQYVGMGKDFYDKYRCVQELFEEATNCIGLNFVRLCFASSEKELAKPLNAYLALFLVQSSIYRVLREYEIAPGLITGWGVGHVSAHYAAGVLNFPDGLYILKKYMEFFEELMSGYDVSIVSVHGIERNVLEESRRLCNVADVTKLAIIRDEKNFVVGGVSSAMNKLCSYLQKQFGVGVVNELHTYGLHLLVVNEIVNRLNQYLEKIDCKNPQISLINQSGLIVKKGTKFNKLLLTEFMYNPIDMGQIVKQLQRVNTVIQIGPGSVTFDIIKKYFDEKKRLMIIQRTDLKELCDVRNDQK